MAPTEHLRWLDENIGWFADLPVDVLGTEVPACPGWDVEKVFTHLAFGMGLAYPVALAAAPDTEPDEVWSTVSWPTALPTGAAAIEAFERHTTNCSATFAATDPDTPCWTYDGPGLARFWFRRAAIETTLHRMDVHEALGLPPVPLASERSVDAIAESIEFALPLAATMTGGTAPALSIEIDGHDQRLHLGDGPPQANMVGNGENVLAALWGRNRDRVAISGDRAVARSWMAMIGEAFAGR